MRVAIVGDYPLDTQIRGGVQAAFIHLARGLQRFDDLELHIITRWQGIPLGDAGVERDGVIVHLLPVLPRFELARMYRTYQLHLNDALARIQPDVVHSQGSDAHGYVVVGSGHPAVVTVHGIMRQEARYVGSPFRRLRDQVAALLTERYSLRHTRHLIAISRYVTTHFRSMLQPDINVYYIPNAVDEGYFNLQNIADGHTILFAGHVIPLKRTLDLVKAFEKIAHKLPRVQLRIAGEAQSESAYAETVRAYIRETRMCDRVHMLGNLSESAILREFAACDVLVLPSAQENAPMVIAQAMAAGKPVVATPVGGVPEMVSDRKTGFLTAVGDLEGLASTLLRLFQSPELRTRMGQAGRQFALNNYQVASVARRTYEVYQNVMSPRR